MESSSSDNSE
ncbi:hypothetical protein AYI70_g7853, partial [Smittium culicis]